MRHFIPAAALAAILLAACSESSTAPETSAPDNSTIPATPPSFSATLPGTSTVINSASCNLVNSTTGEVRCNWDISNPDHISLEILPGALMEIAYQCVNSSTGKVQSSGISTRWAWWADYEVTDANPTGTNIQLATATPPSTYTRKYTKLNVCKGKQTLVVKSYAMQYWDVFIDNFYIGQPDADYKWTCLGSDERYGCESVLID
jgi:hypothetical protein